MNEIRITGIIIPNEFGSIYRALEIDHTTPAHVAAALANTAPGEPLTLYIDSYGGICDSGFAIINSIRDWAADDNATVNVRIGSIAASMAAVIAFSFPGTITAAPNARIMLHACSGQAAGRAVDIKASAQALEIIDAEIVRTLAARAGKPEDHFRQWLAAADKWLSPAAAKAEGLVDEIEAAPAKAIRINAAKAAKANRSIAAIAAYFVAAPAAIHGLTAALATAEDSPEPDEPEEPAKPAEPTESIEPRIAAALTAALEPIKASIATLTKECDSLRAAARRNRLSRILKTDPAGPDPRDAWAAAVRKAVAEGTPASHVIAANRTAFRALNQRGE